MRLNARLRIALQARFDAEFERLNRRLRRRRPPEASLPQMAEPPRGPLPLAGGAAALPEYD